MARIGCTRPVRFVASVAIRRQRCVVVIHMALGAGYGRMGAGQWKRRVVVVEGCARPCSSCMAGLA